MKIMKLASFILLSAMVFALPACGSKGNTGNESLAAGNELKTAQASDESETGQKSVQSQETNCKYIVKELGLKRGASNIYGQAYLPGDGTGTYPVVIIGHEFGANHNSVAQYAKMFAESGIASCIFDFCGGGNASESDGSMLDMSVLTEVEDMKAVLDQIKEQDFSDKKKIFLMGASQGGLVAALTASERSGEIGGLIMFYPALLIPDTAREMYKSPEEIPDTVSVLGVTVGKRYYEDILNLDVYNTIGKFKGDVLIVHGDSDGLVPVVFSERAADVYRSAKLVKIPGANHGFRGEDAKKAGQEAIQFVVKHIQ